MKYRFYGFLKAGFLLLLILDGMNLGASEEENRTKWNKSIQLVLDQTKPLQFQRGDRLPLYLWPAMNPGNLTDPQAEELVRILDERGIGLVCSWSKDQKESLAECLPVARAQKKLGQRVNINATSLLYSFCDASEETAHVDRDGHRFFEETFGTKKMGCPFRLEQRIEPIRERFTPFLQAYETESLPVDFVFTDWEIDGPLEWNHAYDSSQKCRVCQEHLPQIGDFLAYQHELRQIRSRLQRLTYAEPILRHFPNALVGNYAVYPHDGWRYWYDYFEKYVDGQPMIADQNAKYRHWANDFESTGYTYAMPVVYPWSWTWNWYDFEPGDYRWFYNGLLVGSNAGRSTPSTIPIICFVHWHTVDVGESVEEKTSPQRVTKPKPKQMSEWCYQELLWHLLLRGVDTFYLWCAENEQADEVRLLHPVWAAAQEYGDFLEKGTPIRFEVPKQPGTVVSGLRIGNRILVRRTDFLENASPVTITVNGKSLSIPSIQGRCQVLSFGE